MNYKETIQYLYAALPVFHQIGKAAYKANLDNTLALDKHFHYPHKKYKTIHIAGTNGKGSVSHMLASVLQSAGYKTGLYTSPHLFDFRERIKINGKEIPEQCVIDFVQNNISLIDKLKPSFFEITSSMALWFFAKEKVDIAIIETGLGGRLDSTNIITPELSVITNIGLDHTEFLGNTLKKIAAEKAGIIKARVPVVIGERHKNTTNTFTQKAKEQNSPIYFAEDCLTISDTKKHLGKQIFKINAVNKELFSENSFYTIDLEGDYQKKNIITALTSIAVLAKSIDISVTAIKTGLENVARNTNLMGRWQILKKHPTVICDTGHNAHGLAYTMTQLQETEHKKLFIVLGVVNDKDLGSIIPLLPKNAYYYFTQAHIPRAMDANVLAKKCKQAGLTGEIVTPVAKAVNKAINGANQEDIVFIGGSTFVVAEIPNIILGEITL